MKIKHLYYLKGGFCALLVATILPASTITFSTPVGSSVGDGAVNATATFTTGTGSLTITLTDSLANPTSAGQLISDLEFTLSTPLATAGLAFGGTSQMITVAANGSYTLGASGTATGWGFGTSGTSNLLCVICPANPALNFAVTADPKPSQLIIGPTGGGSTYTNANGSIAGNTAHNPFLNGTATFTITDSSITSSTSVSAAVFSFGTQPGINVTGTTGGGGGGGGGGEVPEPATLMLAGAGLLGVSMLRRRAKV